MRNGWALVGLLGVASVFSASVQACVGEDAAGTTNPQDAGLGAETGGGDAAPSDAGPGSDSGSGDAGGDAPEGPRCDPSKPFGAPTLLAGDINTPAFEQGFSLSADELTAIVGRVPAAPIGALGELRYATRASRNAPFGPAEFDKLGNVNETANSENQPSLTANGLTLYFHREVNATASQLVMFTSRATRNDSFAAAQTITVDAVALPSGIDPRISNDGLRIYYTDVDSEFLTMAVRSTGVGAFTGKKLVGSFMANVVLSKDQLTAYYTDVSVSSGSFKVATRANVDAAFSGGQTVPAALADQAFPLYLTDDGCILYISSSRATAGAPGGHDIYEARRPL